jgi:uncharacterized UPF0146 family protein
MMIVVAIGLLVQIAERMERLEADVRAVDPAFQQAPEVVKTVRISKFRSEREGTFKKPRRRSPRGFFNV